MSVSEAMRFNNLGGEAPVDIEDDLEITSNGLRLENQGEVVLSVAGRNSESLWEDVLSDSPVIDDLIYSAVSLRHRLV